MTSYYLSDGLGSTTGIADGSGAVADTYQYDVFGANRSRTGTSTSEFTFTGEQTDPSGLQYLRARYYDPANGRFIGKDPLPLLQRYAYVRNNPAVLVDPSGLIGCGPFGGICDKVTDAGECAVNKGDCVTKPIVNYVTDPWNYGGWIQMGSTALMGIACPLSETGLGAVGCGLGVAGYLYGTKARWDASCDKVKSGEWTPEEAYAMRVVYTLPLQSNFIVNGIVRKVLVPIVKRLPTASNRICYE